MHLLISSVCAFKSAKKKALVEPKIASQPRIFKTKTTFEVTFCISKSFYVY